MSRTAVQAAPRVVLPDKCACVSFRLDTPCPWKGKVALKFTSSAAEVRIMVLCGKHMEERAWMLELPQPEVPAGCESENVRWIGYELIAERPSTAENRNGTWRFFEDEP